MADENEIVNDSEEKEFGENVPIDSKYRKILIAAQRSKQLQKGAAPRVDMDSKQHKSTRIALEEVSDDKVQFRLTEEL